MPEVINSGQVIQRPEIVLDPMFPLPPDLLGVRSKTAGEVRAGDAFDTGGEQDGEDDEAKVIIDLPTPQTMTVISRTTRVLPDNRVVVDVVIETPDIKGVTEFETRITKI